MNGIQEERARQAESVDDSSTRVGAHVVTVTYNSRNTLEDFFRGVDGNRDAIDAVTIVDNASTDDTADLAERLAQTAAVPVQVLRNVNSGFAGGYARAADSHHVTTAPVLCLNPDVVLASGVVPRLLEVLRERPDAGVVTAPLHESDGSPDTASRRRLPTLGASALYSVLGRFTPAPLRYNAQARAAAAATTVTSSGLEVTELEATTGALMLVANDFRTLDEGIFDSDYWMYGEDLQLCVDARRAGRSVLMAETVPSLHVKGVSSGRPRSTRSNRAFHDAMLMYARKNLVRSAGLSVLLRLAVWAHFHLTELRAVPARARQKRVVRVA